MYVDEIKVKWKIKWCRRNFRDENSHSIGIMIDKFEDVGVFGGWIRVSIQKRHKSPNSFDKIMCKNV